MSTTPHYDYFVIGAGSGGVRSARIAAGYGAKVGLAEGSAFGGTCVNLGCVPKKLFAYSADFKAEAHDAAAFGWDANISGFDWRTLVANKDAYIKRLNGLYEDGQNSAGVDVYKEYASFVDDHTLQVGDQTVTADKILIAVGGRPKKPDIEGAELLLTSDDVFHMDTLPERIAIIGGGYIAVEFAHIFHGMGCTVDLIYYKELFLRSFEADLSTHLAGEMRKQGINLHFNTDIQRIEKEGEITHLFSKDGQKISCDMAMAATGRAPNYEHLNLEALNLETTKSGRLDVNDQYQTSTPHIYAVGDVTDTFQLTPVAIREGHVLADRLFGNKPEEAVNYENVATVVFSRPAIGTIGLSEADARDQGYDIDIYKTTFRPMKYALPGRDEKTLMKLVVDKATDKVIGCHMIGLDAPEIMQGFAVAMNAGATKADFDKTIAIHPVSAEEFVTMRTPVTK